MDYAVAAFSAGVSSEDVGLGVPDTDADFQKDRCFRPVCG